MASVAKCMSIMAGVGLIGGAASSYYMQSKINKIAVKEASAHAVNGMIPIGGRTKDGKMWDGKISVDDFKKNLNQKTQISALITGVAAAVGTSIVSGLTLLLRGKVKAK